MNGLAVLALLAGQLHFGVDRVGRAGHFPGQTVNTTALMIIPPTWTVPDAIKIRLGQNTFGRQRAIVEDGHLLLVLHKPPGPDDRTREGLLFWRSPSGDWQFNRGGPGPGGLKRHVQSFAELEAKLTTTYEQATDISTLFDLMETLVPLTRSARNMHLAIQTAREAVKGDQSLVELRDLAYEVERNLDLLLEDTRNEIQHRTARKAEEQARLSQAALHASHRLNILAALFFPLTAIASLFGMNLLHGLNQHSVILFWVVAVVSIAMGFFMKGWVLGKSAPDPKDKTPPKDGA